MQANGSKQESGSRRKVETSVLLALPLALALLLFYTHPFRDEIVSKVFSLSSLNASQRFNIELAVRKLDGHVLKPGEEFSFNRIVGPRSDQRGYRPAVSYLEKESPATVGGGICLLSSAIYQAALAAGLHISERSPHTRTIASVTPGLDATVWYGSKDLKFINSSASPVQLKTKCENNNLYVCIMGEIKTSRLKTAQLRTFVSNKNRDRILVEVFRDTEGSRKLVSRDQYQISR